MVGSVRRWASRPTRASWYQGRLHVVALLGVLFTCVAIWSGGLTRGHTWGDDWAGYLLQARALTQGAPLAEVMRNAEALRGGDVQVGPDAYPWGYPVLLAAVSLIFGEGLESYKSVGLFALVGLLFGGYALGRTLLPAAACLFVAIATVLQPSVFVDSGYIGSDVPFAATSTLALALVLRQWRHFMRDFSFDLPTTLGVVLLSVVAFSIRSNGAVLLLTYVAVVIGLVFRVRAPTAVLVRELLIFGGLVAIGLWVYFRLLPDGSLSHADYLSFDPAVWADRLVRHFHYVSSWATFDTVRGVWKLGPFLIFSVLCLLGWIRRPWEGSVLVGFCLTHFALITVFPFDGGIRYYYPMLSPMLVMFSIGLVEASSMYGKCRLRGGAIDGEGRAQFLGWCALGAVAVFAFLAVISQQRKVSDFGPDAPYGSAAQTTISYVTGQAPQGARIAFFKPRAFRLFSGRVAYAIHDADNLAGIDWYIFNGANADASTQVPEAALSDPASGFRIVREISPFRVYARDRVAGRASIGLRK